MMNLSLRPLLCFLGLALCSAVALPVAPARADFAFVHVTDTHIGDSEKPASNAAKDAALFTEISALAPRPAFVVNTGDVCEVGTDAEYATYRKTLAKLTPRCYVAPGNHDVRWNPRGKEGYVRGTGQPLFQSWDYQKVHFVLLDSTVLLQHWGHFDRAMLDWLARDLQKIGTRKPVVIGFHHWIGRDSVMVDNEQALIDLTAPYNVRLWLLGHGHGDIQWNINGAPAIMAKGLYQGSYHLIEVSDDRLRVLRRTAENAAPSQEIVNVPLQAPPAPRWTASLAMQTQPARATVTVRGTLPAESKVALRLDGGDIEPLESAGSSWRGAVETGKLMPGEHLLRVTATLPDGRVYVRALPLRATAPDAVHPLWRVAVGGEVQSKLVRWDDLLLVPTMDGALVALDARTGRRKWRIATGGAVFSVPRVAGGTVYFGSADHFVYAADARTGRLRWKFRTGGAVFAGAAVTQNIVCIASVDTKIYGLDAHTGKLKWTAPGAGMYQSQAATDGARFFVGGWDNYFRALDAISGREMWKQKFGKAFYFAPAIGSPTVGDGKVFVTSNDGLLHAMDAASGRVLWEVNGPSLGYSGPLFHAGRIYNGSLTGTGRVFCFDAATGQTIWDTPTGSVIYDSSCALGEVPAGDLVYVSPVDGTFSALAAADGALRWQYRLEPGHVLSSPATDKTRVYIGSLNGFVTAFPLTVRR